MAMEAFDLAERLQTIVYVMSDLDLGMNTWMAAAVRVSREAARSRQGARRGQGPGAGRRVGPLQGRGRRRHSVAVAAGHRRAGVLHARLGPQRDGAVHRAAGRLRQEPRPAGAQVRHGEDARAARRSSSRTPGATVGIIAYGSSHWAVEEVARSAPRRGRAQDRRICGCAPIRSRPRSRRSSAGHDRVYVVEQNRDAQMLSLLRMDIDPTLQPQLRSVAALQRAADRRAQHHRRDARAGTGAVGRTRD